MTPTGPLRAIAHDRTGDGRPRTLLLFAPGAPRRLIARIDRGWASLGARVLGSSLDRRLAQGCPPESSLLLAARAQLLVSPAMRLALARHWEALVVQASTPPVARDLRVPLNRGPIRACEPDIRQMLDAVVAPSPTPARGLAMVSRLIGDGTGPLYRRSGSADLAVAVRHATAQLDPSLPL